MYFTVKNKTKTAKFVQDVHYLQYVQDYMHLYI